jgi:hypothetical protein
MLPLCIQATAQRAFATVVRPAVTLPHHERRSNPGVCMRAQCQEQRSKDLVEDLVQIEMHHVTAAHCKMSSMFVVPPTPPVTCLLLTILGRAAHTDLEWTFGEKKFPCEKKYHLVWV